MTGESTEGVPAQEQADLREYGLGGDHAGSRRVRRAFRFAVLAVVFFTLVLRFAEGYLRYDLTESQYRMALTLPDDSARAILRNVVKRDTERSEVPTAKYLGALAAIEEEDVILERYGEAYRQDPNNAMMIVNYGCQLFRFGQFKDARERFREAGIQPPKNALPRYLEAAALAEGTAADGDMSETVEILARANNSGDPLVFPKPFWHPSLPRRGAWHAKRSREIVDRCCAPLYRLKSILVGRQTADMKANRFGDWDSWLESMQVMGEKLVGGAGSDAADLGVSQAMAGVQMQIDAVNQRKRIREALSGSPSEALIKRGWELNAARTMLSDFEEARAGHIEAHRLFVVLPVKLSIVSCLVLLGCYLLAFAACRALVSERTTWAVPHTRLGQAVILSGLSFLLVLLCLLALLQNVGYGAAGYAGSFVSLWLIALGGAICFGIVYPALTLPSARAVCAQSGVDTANVRRSRRMAYISLLRRYYGVVLGGFVCVICAWVIVYRLLMALYPAQFPLLVTGLEEEELEVVRQVQQVLAYVQDSGAGGNG